MKFLCLFLLLVAGCATAPLSHSHWRTYDAGPFSFSVPPNFQKTSEHGLESYMFVFTNENMSVAFNYGAYSGIPLDYLSEQSKYNSQTNIIAGSKVQIAAFDTDETSGNRFNHVIVASFLGEGLTIKAECRETADYADAERIFRSVRFKR